MKLEQRITIEVPRDTLWGILSDFPRAALCLPGVQEVRPLEDGGYAATMRVRVGPVGLNLSGAVRVDMDDTEGRWTMEAQAQDRRVGGGVRAKIEATLTEPAPGRSELRVSADVQFMGRLAELGQPLIRRKAETTLGEFAENLRQAGAAEN